MIVLSDRDGMVALELHQSIWNGLCSDALRRDPAEVKTLSLTESDQLSVWAAQCENPQGQRASLCRAVVQLLRFAPGGVLGVQQQLVGPPRGLGFWESTG
jgi:hypothetical protein